MNTNVNTKLLNVVDLIHRALALGPVTRPEPGATPGVEVRQIAALHHALVEGLWLALHPETVTAPARVQYDHCREDAPGASTYWVEELQPVSLYNWHRPESRTVRVTERPRLLDHIRLVLARLNAGQEPGPLYDSLIARLTAYIDRELRLALPGVTITPQASDYASLPDTCPDCGSSGLLPYRQSTGYVTTLYAACHQCGWAEVAERLAGASAPQDRS